MSVIYIMISLEQTETKQLFTCFLLPFYQSRMNFFQVKFLSKYYLFDTSE